MSDTIITGIASPPRFAMHELAYLLAGRDDAAALRSKEVFGIPQLEGDGPIFRMGLSSLVARGLVKRDQETILPRNEAGLIGFGLGTASQWISIAVRTATTTDIVVFVQGRNVAFMVRGAPASTFDFVPVEPSLTAVEVVKQALAGQLDANQELSIMVRYATIEANVGLFIGTSADGFTLGKDPVFPGDEAWPAPDLEIVPATRGEVDAAVDSLLGATPAP